ncbi:23888_t:CDS:2, partial [Dentiscutata erythropus]
MSNISNNIKEKAIVNTPSDYINLYDRCWSSNPDQRPTLDKILIELEKLPSKIDIEFILNYKPTKVHRLLFPPRLLNFPDHVNESPRKEHRNQDNKPKISQPPFPPRSLNLSEIVNETIRKYKKGKISRAPNAYLLYHFNKISNLILYKKYSVATFKNSNSNSNSRQLSKEAWHAEPPEVKNVYKEYAKYIIKDVKKQIPYCFVNKNVSRNSETSDHSKNSKNLNQQLNQSNSSQINHEIIIGNPFNSPSNQYAIKTEDSEFLPVFFTSSNLEVPGIQLDQINQSNQIIPNNKITDPFNSPSNQYAIKTEDSEFVSQFFNGRPR